MMVLSVSLMLVCIWKLQHNISLVVVVLVAVLGIYYLRGVVSDGHLCSPRAFLVLNPAYEVQHILGIQYLVHLWGRREREFISLDTYP